MYGELDELWCSIPALLPFRPYKLWRHKLGTDISKDSLVLEEKDPMFSLGMGKSR